ncbi:MAG TPA: hypothetical protein VM325_04940 [Alphaproteobacteria bacterium]|nr:hypothetical protein [Alphaproteobacteria bacterium]
MSRASYEFEGPVIAVHTQAQAEAALAAAARAGRPLVLTSPPDAAAYIGAGMFRAMVAAARRSHPQARSLAVLDCGARAGDAMGALREGIEVVCFRGDPEVAARLADMAEQVGARVVTELIVTLDLAGLAEPEHAVFACLSG